jgi:predicted Zn-ribbon and HTH transcriptional regulator
MPQVCTICRHASRDEIDQALIAGESFRNIAKRYGTSATALFRHRSRDLPTALVKAKDASETVRADTLLERLKTLNTETLTIFREARAAGTRDNELALKAIARVERQLEFEARLLGELDESAKIAVGVSVTSREPQSGRISALEELKNHLARLHERMGLDPDQCGYCGRRG